MNDYQIKPLILIDLDSIALTIFSHDVGESDRQVIDGFKRLAG